MAIFLLIVVLPLAELVLLLQLGDWLGVWPAVAIVCLTGIVGSRLAFREGLQAWRRLGGSIQDGNELTEVLLDALVLLVSGVLLMAPGIMTDVVGLLGLFAPTRRTLVNIARRTWRRAAGLGGGTAWKGTGHARPKASRTTKRAGTSVRRAAPTRGLDSGSSPSRAASWPRPRRRYT